MTGWVVRAVLAGVLGCGGVSAIAAGAAPTQPAAQQQLAAKPTDLSARRHARRHHRYTDRRIYQRYVYSPPSYIDRPHAYAPAPFFPFLGLGYGLR